jgi:hypothetical protein
MIQRVIGALLMMLLVAIPASAQQGTTELRGRVIDAQGAVLPGVTVVVRNQETGMVRDTVSGQDGTFIASGLVPGTYQLAAELQGFKKFERKDLRLEVGKTSSIDVSMSVGTIEETVTVTSESPLVDVTSKEIGGNITSETLVKLPSVNGNFVGFVGLLPGIIPSISTESFGGDSVSVNGQDPRNNNYMLDGGNNNDDVIGQRAGTQARTPIEAIQEFQVITGQYDAQYGRTSGAIVNAVTKSGTNQLRGSAFGFFQDGSLTTKDYFAKEKGLAKPDTQYQRWGGTVGGPIVRDKMHFFGSLERFAIDRPNTINIPARPEFNGTEITKDRVWNTIIRGDHQVNNNTTYSVRWLRETSPQKNQIISPGNPPGVTAAGAREESDVDQTLSVNLNQVLTHTKVNTLRLTWTRENVAFANPCFNGNGRDQAACPPQLTFQTFVDQQSNLAQFRINDGIQAEETLAWFLPNKRGDHDIKTGVQYEYSGAANTTQDNMNGTFTFGTSNGPFNSANAFTYPDRFSIRVGGPLYVYEKAHYFSAFAQDKWRVTKDFTVSLGLRYDLERIPLAEPDNPLVDKYPTDDNNIQPRLGATYNLNGGKSVVRAGYGRFFDKTHFELIGGLYTGAFSTSSVQTFPAAGADLGPRNGNLPTNPFLVNGPTVNHDLLAAQFPSGVAVRNTAATWDNEDRRVPHTDEITAGFEHQLMGDLAVSADYIHSQQREMLMVLNLNPQFRASTVVAQATPVRIGSATLTQAMAELQAIYPGFVPYTGAVNQFVNRGEVDYNAIMLQLKKRFSHSYSAQVSYTYGKSRGNTTGNGAPGSNFQVGDDMHLDLNEGPTSFDIPQNFTFSGTGVVPKTKGLQLSWVLRALSGTPFSIINTNFDPDQNGIQAEPLPVADYAGTGNDGYAVKDYKAERNGARGPGYFQADMRFGYVFNLQGRRRLEVSADVFNLSNRANFANPSGDQAATSSFLVVTAYSASYTPRKAQIGVRYEF